MRKTILVASNISWIGVVWVSLVFGNPIWALPAVTIASLSVWYHSTESKLAQDVDTIFAVVLVLVGVGMLIQTPLSSIIFVEATLAIMGSTLFISGYYLRKNDKLFMHMYVHSAWHFVSAGLFGLVLQQYLRR